MVKSLITLTLGSILLLMFLISTAGISFYSHECKSENRSELTIYPEILGSPSTCCGYQMASGQCELNIPVTGSYIKEPDCCINSLKYYRLATFFKSTERTGFKPISVNLPIIPVPVYMPDDKLSEPAIKKPAGFTESPPVYGRKLLYFIHSSKIPDPDC